MPLLGSNTKSASPARPEDFDLACRLYRDGAVWESYRLFAELEKAEPGAVANQVNLALCLMRAGQWQAALARLEKALALLKQQEAQGQAAPEDDVHRLLLAQQAASNCYNCPMPADLAPRLPAYARQVILRLQVDACAELALWGRVQALGAALAGKGYANVEQALAKAPQ